MQLKQFSQKSSSSTVIEDQLFWEKHFKDFAKCNLSRKAYCQAQALNYDRFQYWYHKLKTIPEQAVKPRLKPIPVQLKADQSLGHPLCQLQLKDGHQLLIYERELLEVLLPRIL